MAITSGFFDSVNEDRLYDAEQITSYFDGLVSDGVYESIGNRFAVSAASSGLAVSVGTGRAIIKAHWIKNDEAATVSLSAADVQYPRIDAIVLRLDMTARAVTLVAKTGTPAASPTIPAITRTDEVYELYLASVFVAKNATAPGTITDLRPSTYCGWVTGLIQQVDTSGLFAQWQAAYQQQFSAFAAYIDAQQTAFDEWFSNLTETLNVDTSIEKLQNTVTITNDTTWFVNIGIPEYDSSSDVLFAYCNGKILAEDEDYTVNGQGFALINRNFANGDRILFIVLHNVVSMNNNTPQVGNAATVLRGTMLTQVGQAQRATTVIDMTDYAWETGSGNVNTGTFDNDLTTRLRCNSFTAIPANRYTAILSAFSSGNVGLESVIYWYASAAESSYLGYHNWSVNGTEISVPEGAQYFRLNLKIDNETDMVPTDLGSCYVTFLG